MKKDSRLLDLDYSRSIRLKDLEYRSAIYADRYMAEIKNKKKETLK